jgi:hypothetical protein
MRRYTFASLVAVGLVLAGGTFVRVMTSYVASLGVPPGGGIELPSSTIWLIWLSDLLNDFWWALIPLVFIVCFGIAILVGFAWPTGRKMNDSARTD